nr:hypothetical protein [uncultured Sphingomonas sp.]
MPNASDIAWFKKTFGSEIDLAVAGTIFDLDMLTALACQETGYIWGPLRRKGLGRKDILRLCVGDTLDRASTFPKDKDDLERVSGGPEMFQKARAALIELAGHIPSYAGAARNPRKFCKGFGIFQFDMQFFGSATASYFLGGYADFSIALQHCIEELTRAARRAGVKSDDGLTDMEKAAIAIAYNTGRYRPALGLKQGYKPDDGPYYGEAYYAYLQLARSVPSDPVALPPAPAPQGPAVLPPVTPVTLAKPFLVYTEGGLLNVRSTPEKKDRPSNIVRGLPSGHPVSVIAGPTNGFLRIETNLQGAFVGGWASASFLRPASQTDVIEALGQQEEEPVAAIPAVWLPLASGTVIKRTAPANAGSLNEGGQARRTQGSPEQLKQQLADIVGWLAVDDPAHRRYQPRDGLTFCNIYAHDFCHLAGIYLPRIWWSSSALMKIAGGQMVEPRYGASVDELRANDLFRWLRDFGMQFGWRQTGSLTKLQLAANSGGIGVIVARRKEEGRSGHITIVVPETEARRAKWNGAGEVTAALQSQAGSTNFRYGKGSTDWWRHDRFAEFAFWIHA